jgi:release factor glutamine methyltransferase
MTIQHILQAAKQKLTGIIDEPFLDAEILLAFTLKRSRAFLYAASHYELTEEEKRQFNDCVNRRGKQEPLAYITGQKEFWSLEFMVTKATLIPRPESELLVETVIKLFTKEDEPKKIADLGTGSGAIALAFAFEKPTWQIYATDISSAALHIAQINAKRLGLTNVSFIEGDWLNALCPFPVTEGLDAIVSNPPYIAEKEWEKYAFQLKFEPKEALISGQEGLEALKILARDAKYHLKSGGYLLLEHGFQQGRRVSEMMQNQGYEEVQTLYDLSRQERVTMGRWGSKK